jgi:hypothetical protein
MLYSVDLDCHGSCLAMWRVCLLVGGWEVILEVLLCGKWFLNASCGVWLERNVRCFEDFERSLGGAHVLLLLHSFHLDSNLARSFND